MSTIKNNSDIDAMLETLQNCQILEQKHLRSLCEKAQQILINQQNVVKLETPIKICGDIHGQFPDLLEIFRIGGDVQNNRYVFLGDYVDRGYYSVETMSYLLALKVKYPNNVTLLRGNHQSRLVSKQYGFYDQCFRKYGNFYVYQNFVKVFDCLPLAALVSGKYFCMHGGLSPYFQNIEEINEQNRLQEVPTSGIMTDLLWSDPCDTCGFYVNSYRGISHYFGPDITKKFIYTNNLYGISRAHEVVNNGFDLKHNNKINVIFSAPNYCYCQRNLASFLEIRSDLSRNFSQFYQVSEHPIRCH